jgi:tetratricopeptide (TPR) repeat protein
VFVRRESGTWREAAFLGALVAPLALAMPLIHPVQGMFRDWDNFVALGSSLAVLTAWGIAGALGGARTRRWVAVAVAASAASCSLAWVLHHADVDRALVRMRAFVDEPPARTEGERVAALDYIGIRNIRLERNAESASAFREASDLVPNPRFLMQWGIAASEAKDYVSAREAYARLIQRTPRDPLAWRGWTSMSARLGDFDAARSGARKVLELVPGDQDATWLLENIDEIEAGSRRPDSSRSR